MYLLQSLSKKYLVIIRVCGFVAGISAFDLA